MRRVELSIAALDDLNWWVKNNPKLLVKIFELIDNLNKTPFEGLGKPEGLKGNYKGYWSRRITDEHRLVYKVENDKIVIMSAKGHY